jgi:hypothetical protein
MLIPISEQVFIPIHCVERISFFGSGALVKLVGSRDLEKIGEEDAKRLKDFITKQFATTAPLQNTTRIKHAD